MSDEQERFLREDQEGSLLNLRRPKFEWVTGPIATRPSQQPRWVLNDKGEWGPIFEGPFQSVVYGELREIATGRITKHAKLCLAEDRQAKLEEQRARWPIAKDNSPEFKGQPTIEPMTPLL
jgi:hypothetical protein